MAVPPHLDGMHLHRALVLATNLVLPGCSPKSGRQAGPDATYLGPPGIPADRFARAARPVAPVISDRWRAEDERERVGEAARVMDWLGIGPGMTVADIGAGSGYYTVRLAGRVGSQGRVLAEDIMPDCRRVAAPCAPRCRRRWVRVNWWS